MFRNMGAPEILLIVVVLLLLFGAGAAKKLPGAARSVGQSLRIFKSEIKEMRNDDEDEVGPAARPAADTSRAEPTAHIPQPLPSGQVRAAEPTADVREPKRVPDER